MVVPVIPLGCVVIQLVNDAGELRDLLAEVVGEGETLGEVHLGKPRGNGLSNERSLIANVGLGRVHEHRVNVALVDLAVGHLQRQRKKRDNGELVPLEKAPTDVVEGGASDGLGELLAPDVEVDGLGDLVALGVEHGGLAVGKLPPHLDAVGAVSPDLLDLSSSEVPNVTKVPNLASLGRSGGLLLLHAEHEAAHHVGHALAGLGLLGSLQVLGGSTKGLSQDVLVPVETLRHDDFLGGALELLEHVHLALDAAATGGGLVLGLNLFDSGLEDYHEGVEGVHVVRVDLNELVHDEEELRTPASHWPVLLGRLVDGLGRLLAFGEILGYLVRYHLGFLKTLDELNILGDVSLRGGESLQDAVLEVGHLDH
mmetsp:Transcript_14244/g.29069  ORF Transcript_14244/g.29069 Transcript_14244/m.29069 type:complete len:369 (-) Transcript_14244:7716-8822(-)